MHFYSADLKVPGSTVVASGSSTNLGIDLIGGGILDWKKKVDLFSEVKYRIVSDAGQFTMVVGAIYKF